METSARLGASALLVFGLTGCAAALLPAVIVPQVAATVGVAGMSAAACAGDAACDSAPPPCASPNDRKIQVTEALDLDIPADEGKVATFAPAYWQGPFVTAGASPAAPGAKAEAGILAVTDQSLVFAASPGAEGVRLPLAGVVNVALQRSETVGAPRQLTVESCFGRLDRFTFGQRAQPGQLDSRATADAAAEINARIAGLRAGAGK